MKNSAATMAINTFRSNRKTKNQIYIDFFEANPKPSIQEFTNFLQANKSDNKSTLRIVAIDLIFRALISQETDSFSRLVKQIRRKYQTADKDLWATTVIACYFLGLQDLLATFQIKGNKKLERSVILAVLAAVKRNRRNRHLINFVRDNISIFTSVDRHPSILVKMLKILSHLEFTKEYIQLYRATRNELIGKNETFKKYLLALLDLGKFSLLAEEKKKYLEQNGVADYIDMLPKATTAILDQKDFQLIVHSFQKGEIDVSKIIDLASLIVSNGHGTDAFINDLIKAEKSGNYTLALLEVQTEWVQKKLLKKSELGGISISDFRTATKKLANQYEDRLDREPEYAVDAYRKLVALESLSKAAYVETEYKFEDAWRVALEIRRRIDCGEPTSLIRIGDGEARFFANLDMQDCVVRDFQERIVKIWWGERFHLTDTVRNDLTRLIESAISSCDIVGVVPRWRIFDRSRYKRDYHEVSTWLFSQSFDALLNAPPEAASERILTSCHIHQSLLKWDLYRVIFNGLDTVSVISCHDLGRHLAYSFGVKIDRYYRIPPESAFEDRFAKVHRGEKRMYPEVFTRLLSEIIVKPGRVVLIAAGFLGKYLCGFVKKRGGIGLDIGSAADYFLGHETRIAQLDNHKTFIRPNLIEGLECLPFKRNRSHRKNVKDLIVTDETRSKNIGSFVAQPDQAIEQYPLLLIGHPRCASGYLTSVLQSYDISVGHELVLKHGMCNWMYAVRDGFPPWGVKATTGIRFDLIAAYARNPLASLQSIALENCQAPSLRFRCYHIWDLLKIDITGYDTWIERAIASYTYWYKIVLQSNPECILRVEHLEEDLVHFAKVLARFGIPLDVSRTREVLEQDHKTNESRKKFDFEKPPLQTAALHSIDATLLTDFEEVGAMLGYHNIFVD